MVISRWLSLAGLSLLLQAPADLGAVAQPPAQPTPAPAKISSPGKLKATATELTPAAADPAAARKAEALTLFGRLDDDRARVFLASGAPDARKVVDCPDLFEKIEVWTYLEHPALGLNARMVFFPEPGTGVFRYWTLVDGETVLLSPKRNPQKPLLETEAGSSGCADTDLVKAAVKDVSRRQVDNGGSLKERGAMTAAPPAPAPGPGAKGAAAKDAPAPGVLNKPMSGRERKKAKDALPQRYRDFLDDVEPILTELEESTFLRLASDYQRDRFVEDFWKRRSSSGDGMYSSFREVYELRVRFAKERYRSINTDQGRIYVVNGPPDGIRKISCEDVYNPIEIWYYERIEALRLSKVLLLFYQPFGTGDFKLWTPLEGPQALIVGGIGGMSGISAGRRVDVTRCAEWRDISSAVASSQALFGTTGAMKLTDELKQGPKPDVEGVDRILLMTTELDPGAGSLTLQRVIRFPEMIANKIRVELALLVDREGLGSKSLGPESFYDLDVVGEIVKGGRLVDNFRYRFDFPSSTVSTAFIPLTIDRLLYPGEYQLRVKVADSNKNAAALVKEKLTVPEVPDASLTPEEKAAREAAKGIVAKLVADPGPRGSLTLVPLAREFATGLVRFETRTTSNDIAYAEFYLNGQKMMTKRRPPFDVDLDLGELPRKYTVKVIGYAQDGRSIAQDEMVLNEGKEAFRIRILSPDKGAHVKGATRVVADLAVPETKKLKQVEFFVNEHRAATLFQPPWQQVVEIPKSDDLGFVRVVATLEDGATTEDLRYINAPKYLSEVDVQAVELYTSVFDKGKPVTGLAKTNFTVLEDGVKQEVDGFEVVTNLPLSLGIGVDTSGSMEESIVDAQKAATEFLTSVMTPRDRCFLVTFDNEPQLVSRFTTDKSRLAQALAGLRAQGSTALWDAVVYGLYQYQGARGRKAFVILSDGEDRSSKFTFEAALDYARKSGVAIYFIGLRIGSTHLEVRSKLNKMARETGGTAYYIESTRGLAGIYKEINEELRSQYLLSYTPQTRGGKWRKIEVKMNPTNLTARTISGYYP